MKRSRTLVLSAMSVIARRSCSRVARRNDGAAVLELQRRDGAPRRIVDPRDDFVARVVRAQLRLVRQLLQRIVVPELDLDAAIQRAALRGVVRARAAASRRGRRCRSRRRQLQASCTRERDAVRARLARARA